MVFAATMRRTTMGCCGMGRAMRGATTRYCGMGRAM
jgi:hypothetical protein